MNFLMCANSIRIHQNFSGFGTSVLGNSIPIT